ncbi:MAG: thioesterase [Treponema sp.]|nr:thioesterase [Treponema sp.]
MNCDAANPKANGIVDVWQEILPVRFGVIDKSDRLTLNAVFQFFQEAAISHAENLGVGREDMARTGQVWILSRMSVQVDRRPKYRETITVCSWPRGFEKLFAIRDYQIKDKNEAVAVSARSAWIIVDIEKRRPLRPQVVMDYLPLNEGLEALSSVTGLAVQENLVKIADRTACYTDLDYNGHVNNGSYIKWIEDALDRQLLEKADKIRFDINYINEILGGETIEIFSAPIDAAAFAFEGRKNGQAAFRAELRILE